MSGTLEVLVYAPADGLPFLKPTFGNTPCSPSGAKDNVYTDEDQNSRSDVGDGTKTENRTKKLSGLLDNENIAEEGGGKGSMTPRPSPQELLKEALGLGKSTLGEDDQSLPRNNFADEMGEEDSSTKGKSIDENAQFDEGLQAVGVTKSTPNNDGGGFSDSLESPHWPHEPRYCADVWQQDGNQNDGTATRYVWSFPLVFRRRALWFAPCAVRTTRGRYS